VWSFNVCSAGLFVQPTNCSYQRLLWRPAARGERGR